MRESLLTLIDRKNILLPSDERSSAWCEPDTVELFKQNLRNQPRDWHYRHHKVYYNINSQGYRTKEFTEIDWENSIIIFGDSMVFGIGVSEEETLSGQLEQMTGIPAINLGIPGSSSTFTLHNTVLYLQSFPPPKYVVYMWSDISRFLIYHERFIKHLGEWNADKDEFSEQWCKDFINSTIHLKMNVKTVRELWKQKKTPYYEFSFFNTASYAIGCEFFEQIDFGRDVKKLDNGYHAVHPGRKTYKMVAEKIIAEFNLPC